MTSQIEELEPLALGKGVSMRLFVDHSKASDAKDYNWVEVFYDGKPDSIVFAVPSHWHRDHDETMEVLEGKLIYTIEGKEKIVSAGDPPVYIPRGVVHGLTVVKGIPTRVTERTHPSGLHKAAFFYDLFQTRAFPNFFLAMRVFYDGDTYHSLGSKWLDYLFVTTMGLLAKPFVAGKPEVKVNTEKAI